MKKPDRQIEGRCAASGAAERSTRDPRWFGIAERLGGWLNVSYSGNAQRLHG